MDKRVNPSLHFHCFDPIWKPPVSFAQTVWLKYELFNVGIVACPTGLNVWMWNHSCLEPVLLFCSSWEALLSDLCKTLVTKLKFEWHLFRIAFSNSWVWNNVYLPPHLSITLYLLCFVFFEALITSNTIQQVFIKHLLYFRCGSRCRGYQTKETEI